jgi:hypothetical protein
MKVSELPVGGKCPTRVMYTILYSKICIKASINVQVYRFLSGYLEYLEYYSI